MPKTIAAIVGRPNVGKSTLFNRIGRVKAAITKDLPGVTRDRIYLDVEYNSKRFTIMDTGGLSTDEDDLMLSWIRKGVLEGIEEADIILHLMDGKDGVMPDDTHLAEIIRRSGKAAIRVVNKIDNKRGADGIADFYRLGSDILPLSAEHGYGFDEVMERLTEYVSDTGHEEIEPDYPKIAILGRQNAGKSTMVNAMLGKERMLVSPIAGTTRDAVDSVCRYYGREYLLIDTAGMRRKPKIIDDVERLSVIRTIKALDRADTAILVIDASSGIVEQDKKIAGLIDRAGCSVIVAFNKWDLVSDHDLTYKKLKLQLQDELWFFEHAPYLTVSSLTKQRLTNIFPLINEVMDWRKRRVPTSALNRLIRKDANSRFKYMTQVGTAPPAFAAFAKKPDEIRPEHLRNLERMIRRDYPFKGTPVKIFLKEKG